MNIRSTFSYVSITISAFAATGLILHTAPALAEQANQMNEVIVVEAPIKVSEVERNNFGARTNLFEIKKRVNYTDLDLSKHVDVVELLSRVEISSKEACEILYAMSVTDSVPAIEKRRCVKDAIDSAEKQMQAAIIAAS